MNMQAVLPLLFQPAAEAPKRNAGRIEDLLDPRPFTRAAAPGAAAPGKAPRLTWAVNPYRGPDPTLPRACQPDHPHLHQLPDPFEGNASRRRQAPGRRLAAALRRELGRGVSAGATLAFGTLADPYPPPERQLGLTRALLEVLLEVEGMTITLTTRGPLVARDVDVLRALDAHHAVTLRVVLPTVDTDLARLLEGPAATPEERLEAVARLAAEGISTHVVVMPMMPALHEDEGVLRPLLEAAHRAGATDVEAHPLSLTPGQLERLLAWMAEELPRDFPSWAPRYRRLYAGGGAPRGTRREIFLAPLRRLRLQYGFPRHLPGRG